MQSNTAKISMRISLFPNPCPPRKKSLGLLNYTTSPPTFCRYLQGWMIKYKFWSQIFCIYKRVYVCNKMMGFAQKLLDKSLEIQRTLGKKRYFFKNCLQSFPKHCQMTTFVTLTPKTYIYGGLSPNNGLCTLCARQIACTERAWAMQC